MPLRIITKREIEKFELEKITKQLSASNNTLGVFAASEWHRLYTPFVPMQTGTLAFSTIKSPWQVTHTQPYAHRQYEGNFKFRKDFNQLATRQWDQAAIRAGKAELLSKSIQSYIDSGKAGL